LSVFVAGFTLEAAQRVAGDLDIGKEEVFDAVAGLLVKSLASADTSGSATRYRLLDTTRTYAAMKLTMPERGTSCDGVTLNTIGNCCGRRPAMQICRRTNGVPWPRISATSGPR